MDTDDRIEVRSSRLWALFHVSVTRILFPARMVADHIGASTNIVAFWLTPWRCRRAFTAVAHRRGHPHPWLLLGRDQRRKLGRA
jgi:hypothetical protein